ncbi:hypothetical protein NQ317_014777 [Molorchus minor]|uniref:Uncharacterized protein n=1 Tax=Molorchus minor TaxID=1323400 RepID=A0ABQ9IY40_9CUCU|nr:hypothetical protein NQ317_014777 [Molorchus minor]
MVLTIINNHYHFKLFCIVIKLSTGNTGTENMSHPVIFNGKQLERVPKLWGFEYLNDYTVAAIVRGEQPRRTSDFYKFNVKGEKFLGYQATWNFIRKVITRPVKRFRFGWVIAGTDPVNFNRILNPSISNKLLITVYDITVRDETSALFTESDKT